MIQKSSTSKIENLDQHAGTYYGVLFALLFLSSALGGTVSTLMSVYLPVAVKDLLGQKDQNALNEIAAYINAVFILGWAFGGFFAGVLGDKVGRKKSFLIATGLYGLATCLTAYMPSWIAIIGCRFFSGFGVGGVLVTGFTLMAEVWPEKTKHIFIGILSISIPIGIFSAGLINYFIGNWRQGFYIGIIPLLISILGYFFMNESKVWNKNNQSGLNLLFSNAYRKNLIMGSVLFGTMLIGLWAIFSWLPTWVQSLITVGDAQKERGLSMMLLGMGGLTGGFISGWIVKLIGLRNAMLSCFFTCTILSFILFKTNAAFSPVIYIEIGVIALFFGVSQGVLSAYIPQIFPTNIRSTATGFCFNIGRLFTAAAVLFVGVLVNVLGGFGNALFIFSLVFLIGLIALLVTKEKHINSNN